MNVYCWTELKDTKPCQGQLCHVKYKDNKKSQRPFNYYDFAGFVDDINQKYITHWKPYRLDI